jgi:hypothetical protein
MKRKFFHRTIEDDDLFERFTSRLDIVIKHMHTEAGSEHGPGSMVYYEDLPEITSKEKVKLNWIKDKAIALALDEVYQKLSNAKQRQFYLLETYGYCSADSVEIMEYLGMMKKLAEGV